MQSTERRLFASPFAMSRSRGLRGFSEVDDARDGDAIQRDGFIHPRIGETPLHEQGAVFNNSKVFRRPQKVEHGRILPQLPLLRNDSRYRAFAPRHDPAQKMRCVLILGDDHSRIHLLYNQCAHTLLSTIHLFCYILSLINES